jgi:uncharacterized protein (DUF885 family)
MTTVRGLADELLDAVNEQYPLLATLSGFRDRDDRLSDFSEAGEVATAARLRHIVARMRALDPVELSASDRRTCAVIQAHAGAVLDQLAAGSVEYTITPLYVAPAAQLLFGLPMIGIVEPVHAEGYLARLRTIPEVLTTLADRHRAGVAAGRLPVRGLVDAAVAHLDRYLANRDGNPLRRPQPPADGTVDVPAFMAERDRLIDGMVRVAFAGYRTALAEEIAPHGRPDDRVGLCWLPDGEVIYDRLIRTHTTVARGAQELHCTGLELIKRLGEEYRSIGGRVFGPTELPGLFERLRTDPALRWRDAAEILTTARAAIARAEQVAPQWFGRLPRGRCTVEAVPADEAPGAPGGNYLSAALDGSRPAIYFVNTYQAQQRTRYSAEAVAYHEVIPGHHVQVGLAREWADLPPLRRVVPIDAFAEGWGLYAERLADEMGLYSDDLARLGMLAGDSMRAARLVVDTGIHALGWDRQRVIDFLRTNTPMPHVDIEQETDRYIADPGQALSYMVGRLEIERIRAEARQALGERFDIRGFHDAALRNGELPLGALAEVIDDWVAAQSRIAGTHDVDLRAQHAPAEQ